MALFLTAFGNREWEEKPFFPFGTAYTYHALQHRPGLRTEHKQLATKLAGQKVSLPCLLFFLVPVGGMYMSPFTQKVHFEAILKSTHPNLHH